jgi:hypothetical protein
MALWVTPLWVWVGTLIVALPVLAVLAAVALELRSKRPLWARTLRGTRYELWSGNNLPAHGDLLIVPVAPDLKMIAGSALWARGVTAGNAQREADPLAPRDPGDAVLVAGSRYRFGRTALAVVMDRQKRYAPEWIRAALRRAVAVAADQRVTSIIIPDWTRDLVRQPRTPDAALLHQTCEAIAPIIAEAALTLAGDTHRVIFWVQEPSLAGIYRQALSEVSMNPQPSVL